MKKYIDILALGFLSLLCIIIVASICYPKDKPQKVGANQKVSWNKSGGEHLKLKANKDKILSYKIVSRKNVDTQLLGASTEDEVVEYKFISDYVSTSSPYFDNNNISSAEILKQNEKGHKIAFYSDQKWFKDTDGIIHNIETATTTLGAYNEQISLSVSEKILNYFINSAVATTSYTTVGTTSYTPPGVGLLNLLIVAGGGGGGSLGGGGGGGGGVIASSSFYVTATSYTVTVGSGGSGSNSRYSVGGNGQDSVFGTYTAIGGGGGGSIESGAASGGGCGGGGGNNISAGALSGGTGSQGYNGGDGLIYNAGNNTTGGGGGMSSVGENGKQYYGGNGGSGISSSISGSLVGYAGGGGGGGNVSGGTATHGGGNGAVYTASNGTSNTGGGGGGGFNIGAVGGNGGSGIVILEYRQIPIVIPTTTVMSIKAGTIFKSNVIFK